MPAYKLHECKGFTQVPYLKSAGGQVSESFPPRQLLAERQHRGHQARAVQLPLPLVLLAGAQDAGKGVHVLRVVYVLGEDACQA